MQRARRRLLRIGIVTATIGSGALVALASSGASAKPASSGAATIGCPAVMPATPSLPSVNSRPLVPTGAVGAVACKYNTLSSTKRLLAKWVLSSTELASFVAASNSAVSYSRTPKSPQRNCPNWSGQLVDVYVDYLGLESRLQVSVQVGGCANVADARGWGSSGNVVAAVSNVVAASVPRNG